MTDNKIIKSLECLMHDNCEDCPYYRDDCVDRIKDPIELSKCALDLINRQQSEIERLKAFKSYFDELYGKGLDVANWHLNSELEPFDNFYESALQEVVGEK